MLLLAFLRFVYLVLESTVVSFWWLRGLQLRAEMQEAASWGSTAIQETLTACLSVGLVAPGNWGLGYNVCIAHCFLGILVHSTEKRLEERK